MWNKYLGCIVHEYLFLLGRVLILDINRTFLLYCRYTSNSDYLTTDDLLLFLEAEQGVMFHTHCHQRKKIHLENILNSSAKTDNKICWFLFLFFRVAQLSRVGKEHCLDIIKRCEPTEEGRRLKCLGIDGKALNHLYSTLLVSTCKFSLSQVLLWLYFD